MGNNDDTGLKILAVFIGIVLALYFISLILQALGVAFIFIAIIVIFYGLSINNEKVALIGGIGLVLGIILVVIGHTGLSFFEHNPTGKNLLDAANTVVNSTKDIVKK